MRVAHAEFEVSNTEVSKCPTNGLPEYAFIGRSNVGKSSLINMICNRKKLARTSSTPGKTKLINHFIINKKWYLVDLPGYGYAKASKLEKKKYQKFIIDYFTKRKQLISTFLLIDLRLEPQKIDNEFMLWLGENLIPFSIVFTKSDKLTENQVINNVSKYLNKLRFNWESTPKHFVTSSAKKIGREELLMYIEKINQEPFLK